MLNRIQIKEYRILRGLSQRDVAQYSGFSQPFIVQIESGERALTEENYRKIVDAINDCYKAKKNGTYEKPPRVNVPKTKIAESDESEKEEPTAEAKETIEEKPKKTTKKKTTAKTKKEKTDEKAKKN